MIRNIVFVLAALLFTPVVAFGIEPGDVEPLLKRPLLDRAVVLREVRQFCDARVPKMPEIKSAEQWQAEADRLRAEVLERIVYRGEAARWRDAPGKVEWLGEIPGGPGYKIKKLRYEALPGMWIPALLYEPENLSGKVPGGDERQRPFARGQGVRAQADPLHQPGEEGHSGVESRMGRHGTAWDRELPALPDEPDRPVRHQRPGAVLPVHEARARRAPCRWRTPIPSASP